MYKNNQSLLKDATTQTKMKASFLIASLIFMFSIMLPTQAKAETSIPLCEITRSLKVGSSGEDVKCLQRYLNYAGFTVATTGSGSPGNESSYYGEMTASAVARWQNANSAQVLAPVGLTTGSGFFGSLSFNRYVSIVRVSLGLSA